MEPELEPLLSTVPNPFEGDRVDSAWDKVPVDVETINRRGLRGVSGDRPEGSGGG
ncbi:MAG: hypothetical protein KatS3mg131_2524 [Candidatus Tectimicrobiota bacterium]|nr:MAG: hypothetical protein KatS3mg131_2524 [Candidatus Tectomicrobia bacterium]